MNKFFPLLFVWWICCLQVMDRLHKMLMAAVLAKVCRK